MSSRKALRSSAAAASSPLRCSRQQCLRRFTVYQSQHTNPKARPNLPFLYSSSNRSARNFTSERRQWLKHETKLVVRYMVSLWGAVACVCVIAFFVREEMVEREYPTPHEWAWLDRKCVRVAKSHADPSRSPEWPDVVQYSRMAICRLDKEKGVHIIEEVVDPSLNEPDEFSIRDISEKNEEWRRGYFDASMLCAKAAEHSDGYVKDVTRDLIAAPYFVIGPSNPQPKPIPPGQPHAPREEDCVLAFPTADAFYMKILSTQGFTPRQRMEAALEYASWVDYKQRSEEAKQLYDLALAEATQSIEPSALPYNPKTFVLKDKMGSPSMNVLDALTAIANRKARSGDVNGALPIYLSILKARRGLSKDKPRTPPVKRQPLPIHRQIINFFSEPDYPAPPPDGTQPPWRNSLERCQEASLNIYIGEILFATSSREDGLAWTREGVDEAEEQLRKLALGKNDVTKRTCRECLGTGLDNWSTMVKLLLKDEEEKKAKKAAPKTFSFWSGSSSESAEGRWAAEEAVVKERVRRTKELVVDAKPVSEGIFDLFKA